MNRRRVTIREVAQRAGVSVATVSRVFADASSVSERLRAHVRGVADRLGYEPHAVAQSLALGRTKVVGILVSNLANPYTCGMIKRILHEAHQDGYRTLIADCDDDPDAEPELGENLARRVDGLVVVSPRSSTRVLEEIPEQGQPMVVVNRTIDSPQLGSVVVDSECAVRRLALHLADMGHRELAYLRGPASSWEDDQRWRALRQLDRPDVTITPIRCGGTLAAGLGAVGRVLDSRCTAVLTFNDMAAFGLLTGLTERGVPVPERVSVCGFDDVPFARCVAPSLTTANGRQLELGTAAWSAMADLLGGARVGAKIRLVSEPVFRCSTGPAPMD